MGLCVLSNRSKGTICFLFTKPNEFVQTEENTVVGRRGPTSRGFFFNFFFSRVRWAAVLSKPTQHEVLQGIGMPCMLNTANFDPWQRSPSRTRQPSERNRKETSASREREDVHPHENSASLPLGQATFLKRGG